MEKNTKPHNIMWKDRRQGSISGVRDVLSFDENSVILETEQGKLTIKGKNLHIARLMLEQGTVDMDGSIDSLIYSGNSPAAKESILKRLLQ